MPGRPNILWLMTVEQRAGPAGLKTRHTHFAKSLVPQLEGAPGDPDRAIYAEGGYDPHEPHCFEGRRNDRIFEDVNHTYYPKGVQQ